MKFKTEVENMMTSKSGYFLFLMEFLVLLVMNVNGCEDISGTNVTIFNLTDDVRFTLNNRVNLSDYDITVTYSWNVEVPPGERLDGFMSCMEDVDEVSVANIHGAGFAQPFRYEYPDDSSGSDNYTEEDDYYGFQPYGLPRLALTSNSQYHRCQEQLGIGFWVTDLNGTYTECQFPCDEQLGSNCVQIGITVCALLGRNCVPLAKDARQVSFDIDFGRRYKFSVHPYVGRVVEENPENSVDKISLFCSHHLIEVENISRSYAYDFCRTEQNISALSTASSPVTNLTIYQVMPDFDDNTATAIVRWSAPHDVARGRRITHYFFNSLSNGIVENTEQAAKSPEEERLDPFYNVTVTGLPYNEELSFTVTPYIDQRDVEDCFPGMPCNAYGQVAKIYEFIRDYNACQIEANDTATLYCDPIAVCVDESAFAPVPAHCTCPPGYAGNGINPLASDDGTGCRNYNACQSRGVTETVCDPNAICVDLDPPDIGVRCYCPDDYVGDGIVSGSGCTEKRLIVAIAVGVPLAILLVTLVFCFVWRYRRWKRRTLDRTLSKFVVGKSNSYTAPLVISNNGVLPNDHQLYPSPPAFGKKIELERSSISKLGVLGRGNFGVVHKAILSRNGTEEVVAVKSLTGANTTHHREDFLTEIALILSLGNHDNIMSVVGVCTTNTGDDSTSPLLVTEYMKYGDLLHFLWDSREVSKRQSDSIYDFTEISLFNIGRQVAHGLQFLSQSRVIHGDVAARNILVGENLQCKISDFGLANDVYRYGIIKGATERRVPFKWVSPERMMGGKSPITWRSDVWSFGILLYEMVTLGAAPYSAMDPVTIFYKLKSGYRMPQPSSCSDYLYRVMLECWQWDSMLRPEFRELEKRLATPLSLESESSESLHVKIQVDEEIDESQYQEDIGRRDALNGSSANGDAVSNSVNGVNATNHDPALTNGHATPASHTHSNGTVPNGKPIGATPANSCLLWSGDITVSLEPKDKPTSNQQSASTDDVVV